MNNHRALQSPSLRSLGRGLVKFSRPARGAVGLAARLVIASVLALLPTLSSYVPAAQAACANAIVCENQLAGTPASTWDISGSGDPSIQGFSTDISYNKGATASFKVTSPAAFHLDIYRVGYYQGNGARKIDSVSQPAAQNQPACFTDNTVGLTDCSNWSVSATWTVPSTAVSGVYFARAIRNDTGGASHIMFIVRDDASHSDVLFQTDDPTWQAYNQYGGSSTYQSTTLAQGRAYKVSYNRPFATRGQSSGFGTANWLFYAEYPMIRFLEQNGYDLSYFSGLDTDRSGALIKNHKTFLSVGHDEYWSAGQRASVEAARDAGVNLAFFSGNAMFWKTRWEPGHDGTPNRNLVVYKETKESAPIDPLDPPTWTGTWRDPTWSPPADGGRPENAVMGTIFQVNRGSSNIAVPAAYSKLRLWRNTAVANLAPGGSLTLGNPAGGSAILGYEWDTDVDNGFRPAGTFRLSQTTVSVPELIQDFGNVFSPGTINHYMTEYRASSGALVFSAGTVEWAWGLDVNHDTNPDIGPAAPDSNMQQATVNILADMGAQPATLLTGLVAASKSTDATAPSSTIAAPANGSSAGVNTNVNISGSAADLGGGVVGGVEVSTDGGTTWHPATGTTSWSYAWTPKFGGPATIKVRASDDSGNLETPGAGITVNVTGDTTPPTISAITAHNITGTGATIGWTTNETANSQVQYGTTTAYGSSTSLDPTLVTTHSQVLGGLAPTTTYHYKVLSKDAVGNQATSADVTFSTPAAGTVALLGDQGIETLADQEGAGSSEAFEYLASTSGTANVLYLYLDAASSASKVLVGVYNNTPTNDPGTLLAQATITAPQNGAWNSVALPATTITAGQKYWIATLSPAGSGTMFFRDTSNGTRNVTSSQTNLTSLPATFTVGPTFSNTPLSAYLGQVGGSLDAQPPTVSLTAPAAGASVSGTSVNVTATASDNVGVASVQLTLDGADLGSPLTTAPFTFTWDTTTVPNGSHTLSARAADAAGNVTTAGNVAVTVANTSNPAVISNVTAAGQTSSGATITWTTDKAATSQVNYGTTTAYGSSTTRDTNLVTSHSQAITGLNPSTTYNYQVVSTDEGNLTTSSANFTFTTAPDTTPPVISGVQTTGTTDTGTSVTWTTDQASDSQVEYGTTAAYGSTTPLASAPVTAHSVALSGLTASTTYHYRVKSKDPAGNLATSGDFTLVTNATCPCSIWATTRTPTTAAAADSGSVELGVKFRADAAGFIYGIRYFKAATNTGTHVGSLWSSTGTLLASATFANEGSTGWQQVQFSTPIAIQANTTYVASYHAPNGNYSADPDFFASSGADNPPLHALANGVDGLDGMYQYAAGSVFPTQSFNSTNYWVDVVYSTTSTATIPPFITNVQASAGTSSATVTWGTNTATDSQVEYGATAAYGSSTALDPTLVTNHSATLPGLTPATSYHYRVKSSGSVSGDLTFTTASLPTCPCTIWPSTATPANAAVNDGQSIEVGVKFRSDTAGYINGIRFYKGTTNTGTHTGNLWSSTGALLASATFSGETASGWQQVLFSAPVQVQANTTYVASYHSSAGVYAADGGAFASKGVDNGYLHALANGVDGSNGVYLYSGASSAFPTQSFNATNYWVDVVFNTNLVDTVPPSLTDASPAPNATRVSIATAVTATFSEPIANPASIAFTLKDQNAAAVSATVTYNPTTRVATLQPAANLTGTTYTATLSGAADAGGNTMAPVSWSFGVQPCPCTIWPTTAAPTNAAANDGQSIEVGVKFRSDVGGYINGIRFYKGTTNTGTHTGNLWSSTGTLLASATFSGETASGWQQVLFSAPVQIQANTTYVAAYHSSAGIYAADAGFFATTAVNGGSLHALASGTDGPNGVFGYGAAASVFPTQSFNNTNYWVDVVFNTDLVDTAPPTISAVQASGVTSTGATVTWTTNENSDSQVEYGTTTAYGSSSPINTAAATSHSVALTGLTGGTAYHYRVKSKDAAGNLATSGDFTFTTAAAPQTCPCSVFSPTGTPPIAADNTAIEVGMKFRADRAGSVTGVKFYKGAANTGTHVGSLWSSTGALLATATFSGETASGWQTVTFSAPVAIQANTTYVVSYHTNTGNYAATGGGLASAVDNAPLHALASGTDGPNGVFLYSAGSAFPNQSFNATNYWVDVIFQ